MKLLRNILLGAALCTGVVGSMTVAPQQVLAGNVAYGHRFDTFAEAEEVRVNSFPRTAFGPTHIEQFNPGTGFGFYICF
jgi:hypothetical protein